MSTPNYKSWATLRPWVKRATAGELEGALWAESRTFNRGYVKRRLASAAVSKYRQQLRKEYKL
jgi:hypothetical protein